MRRLLRWLLHVGLLAATKVAGRVTYRHWIRAAPDALLRYRQGIEGFESRLYERWGAALDALDVLYLCALEEGNYFNQKHRPEAAASQNFTFDALARLHARGCRVASEARALLRTGHAEGAHARWRTLHEIAVTAFFIRDHDLGERYLSHVHATSHKAAVQYQEAAPRLNVTPFTDAEMADMERQRDALVARFGKEYTTDYGWAATALRKGRVTFRDLEAAVNMDHWRPYYRWASEGQHAGSRGLARPIGHMDPDDGPLLAGPSNAGLADPGMGVAIALSQTTIAFVTSEGDFRALRSAMALDRLLRRVEDAFMDAHEQLEADEERERAIGRGGGEQLPPDPPPVTDV